jgi:hypothetical protein
MYIVTQHWKPLDPSECDKSYDRCMYVQQQQQQQQQRPCSRLDCHSQVE